MKNYILYPCVYGVFSIAQDRCVSAQVKNNGRIEVKNQTYNNKSVKLMNLFLIRGVMFFILGIFNTLYGIFGFNDVSKNNNNGINKTSKSLNVSTKSIVFFIIFILTVFVTFVLLGYVPLKISYYLGPKNYNILIKRIIIALVKIIIICLIFLCLKFMPAFKSYYMFNSACQEKQNEFKQVNFLNYFLCSVILNTFIISFLGMATNKWYFFIINIFISLLVFTINYEVYREIQNVKWLKAIFTPLYWLIYQKPSHLEQKCVNIVLREIELSSSKRDKMQEEITKDNISFSEAYVLSKEILEKAGKFEKSDLDFIFAEVLKKNRAEIKLIKSLSKEDYKKIETIVKRRANGEPISKIFGYTNFYGLDFIVTNDVLSPRMDTERLVEIVLKETKPKQSVLDLGTGSGAIAITIAKNSKTKVTAVDISDLALKVAKQNAKNNNVKVNFIKSNLFDNLSRFSKFDIIVSNPPYIPTKDIDGLDVEVKNYDPILALDGGESGYNFYERIIEKAPGRLNKNGMLFFEVGIGQAQYVKKLLQKNFKDIRIVKDYNKIDRVVYATLK